MGSGLIETNVHDQDKMSQRESLMISHARSSLQRISSKPLVWETLRVSVTWRRNGRPARGYGNLTLSRAHNAVSRTLGVGPDGYDVSTASPR